MDKRVFFNTRDESIACVLCRSDLTDSGIGNICPIGRIIGLMTEKLKLSFLPVDYEKLLHFLF